MKKVFLAMAIAFSLTTFAQTEEKEKKVTVPAIVKTAFTKDFPGKKVKWGMEDGDFEAEFKINGSDASAVYDKKGHKKAVEMTIKTAELPANVLVYVKTNYPKSKITEAAKITDDKNGVTYEAEIGKDGKSYDVLFDANGKFIKIVEGD
ncbi:PepSY-like domain-containing protein [Flavobacterium sp.]|uniref:PepSY-like domain-containing protein n=1 Tax=Flavobacterium sp. TaxID=239 RepID=UPI0038FCD165